MSGYLAPFVEQAFGELFSDETEEDNELIEKCFIENAETKKNMDEIERLFEDDAPDIHNVIPIKNTENLGNAIIEEIKNTQISIRIANPPNPIIIIGSKGAGKTTFIKHLFNYRANFKGIEDHFVIYLDFRKFYELSSNFDHPKIAKEIIDSIHSKYSELELHSLNILIRIYHKFIKENDESIWKWEKQNDEASYQKRLSLFLEEEKKDYLNHLSLLSQYLIRERRKRLIIIIDNADQFSDSIQEKLFVFSHSLARSSFCGTIISLREGYYRKWQNSPPFDAYDSNIYHITAPRYVMILQKRIDYAIEKIVRDKKTMTISLPRGKEISVTSEYIVNFFNGLKESLFAIENSSLIDFINLTTYPNIREGLRIIKIFINSGHTKILEYIEREKHRIAEQKTHRIIPIHEFIKSIALQNRHYYDSTTSILYNVFNLTENSSDHFIKLYILKELQYVLNTAANSDFTKNTTIIEKFVALGYKLNIINEVLLNLIKSTLIETDEQLSDITWNTLPEEFSIKITAKGHYYLNTLINKFLYYDLILQDTPILDSVSFEEISKNFPLSNNEGVRNLDLRKECVRIFLNYLKIMEDKQPNQIKMIYGNFMDSIIETIHLEFENIS